MYTKRGCVCVGGVRTLMTQFGEQINFTLLELMSTTQPYDNKN